MFPGLCFFRVNRMLLESCLGRRKVSRSCFSGSRTAEHRAVVLPIRSNVSSMSHEPFNCRALGRTGDGYTWTREACTSAKSSGLLERKQARACRATPDVMASLVQAARDTSTVCQQAFRHRRWNCSSIERAPDYTPELLTGTFYVGCSTPFI